MKKHNNAKEELWQQQGEMLRDPLEIYGCLPEQAGWNEKSLRYKTFGRFNEILDKLGQTLLVSREYEHLLCSYHTENEKLQQHFTSIPHPGGIAVSPNGQHIYTTSTRNPNVITEWGVTNDYLTRLEDKSTLPSAKKLMPLRSKYYPGAYYFHDLVFIGGSLYANAVGLNGVVKIDMNSSATDELYWQLKLAELTTDKLSTANYLQLNSIAAGTDFESSFFSASAASPGKYRPGHLRFPVDGKGVVFNAKSEIVGCGLTRPHSARLHDNELWVCNSGYGELGKIEEGQYQAVCSLPGWTRGLKFKGSYAFVGFSRVLKKFSVYAPGVDPDKARCGIAILDMNNLQEVGRIEFPYGNQIFQIETIDTAQSGGFLYNSQQTKRKQHISQHYRYQIKP